MTTERPALPAPVSGAEVPAHLEKLVETAKDYARGAKAVATLRAYAADWRHFTAWCRRRGLDPDLGPLPPDPQVVGLYLAASYGPVCRDRPRLCAPARATVCDRAP
jgi:hypothetical protein